MSYSRVVLRNSLVLKRYWRGSVFFTFLNPLLFLSAMGFGMGAMISRNAPEMFREFGGYMPFVATGLLGSSCMNAGVFESTFPILGKFVWERNYEAMLSTPMRVADVFWGELAWICLRMFMIATPFYFVMLAFGVAEQVYSPLAIPAAVLMGTGFASWVMAFTATRERDQDFNGLFRFVITPLFLFSGTFFPLDRMPTWVNAVAEATPLFHGIRLIRATVIAGIDARSFWDLAYLAAFLAVGCWIALGKFKKRLVV